MVKTLILGLMAAIAYWLVVGVPSAWAEDVMTGARIFQQTCSVCHIHGQNLIIPEKNLHLETLHQQALDSQTAIAHQVRYGKNIMPAFGDYLSDEEIAAVAAYVFEQATQGWTVLGEGIP